jgi:hypothetical protein
MQPDDVFQRAFDETTGRLDRWLAELAADAHIDQERLPDFWRASAVPFEAGASPFELILHRRQRADIGVGPETYENLVIGDTGDVRAIGLFPRLLEAIAAGRVATRTWTSHATAAPRRIETLVICEDGTAWQRGRDLEMAAIIPQGACLRRDRWYLPYRR